MSAAEPLIDEIKRPYWNTHDTIKAMIAKAEKAAVTLNEGRAIFECVLSFQTFLEAKEKQIETYSTAEYFSRASKRLKAILTIVRAETTLKRVDQPALGRPSYAAHTEIADYIEGLSLRRPRIFREMQGSVQRLDSPGKFAQRDGLPDGRHGTSASTTILRSSPDV